ncbi:MAG: hypothetical protein HOW73_41080 [Polyangiaceae bacterium]|nr:hypothetical protein [Polyangiaceae bacterium]
MKEAEADVPLSLERFAEASAYLAEYATTERPRLLAGLGVDPMQFAAAQAYWSRAIGEGIAKGEPTGALMFARVYGQVEREVRLRRPSVGEVRSQVGDRRASTKPSVEPRKMRPLPAQVASPEDLSAAVDKAGPNVVVPSYLREGAVSPGAPLGGPKAGHPGVPPAPPAPLSVNPDETAQVDGRKVLEALRSRGIPFDEKAPAVLPAATPITGEQSGETAVVDGTNVRAALVARGILSSTGELVERAPQTIEERVSAPPASAPVGPLPFERFVRYRIELHRGVSFEAVAAKMSLTIAQLAAAEGYWRGRMESEAHVRQAFESMWNERVGTR